MHRSPPFTCSARTGSANGHRSLAFVADDPTGQSRARDLKLADASDEGAVLLRRTLSLSVGTTRPCRHPFRRRHHRGACGLGGAQGLLEFCRPVVCTIHGLRDRCFN